MTAGIHAVQVFFFAFTLNITTHDKNETFFACLKWHQTMELLSATSHVIRPADSQLTDNLKAETTETTAPFVANISFYLTLLLQWDNEITFISILHIILSKTQHTLFDGYTFGCNEQMFQRLLSESLAILFVLTDSDLSSACCTARFDETCMVHTNGRE